MATLIKFDEIVIDKMLQCFTNLLDDMREPDKVLSALLGLMVGGSIIKFIGATAHKNVTDGIIYGSVFTTGNILTTLNRQTNPALFFGSGVVSATCVVVHNYIKYKRNLKLIDYEEQLKEVFPTPECIDNSVYIIEPFYVMGKQMIVNMFKWTTTHLDMIILCYSMYLLYRSQSDISSVKRMLSCVKSGTYYIRNYE